MSDRRAPRLIIEIAFLAALAAALAFAGLETYAIVGLMLIGWALVALFEWGALRRRAHYGSGSPPRWYVPRVTLPPPRPLEQVSSGYPASEPAGDAPTWIASPAMLAEWPVAEADTDSEVAVEEQTQVQTQVHDVAVAVAEQVEEVAPPEVEEPPEPLEPEVVAPPPPPPPPRPTPKAPRRREPVAARTARHRIDPLAADTSKGRRFGRRGGLVDGDADVVDGPPVDRLLPIQVGSED